MIQAESVRGADDKGRGEEKVAGPEYVHVLIYVSMLMVILYIVLTQFLNPQICEAETKRHGADDKGRGEDKGAGPERVRVPIYVSMVLVVLYIVLTQFLKRKRAEPIEEEAGRGDDKGRGDEKEAGPERVLVPIYVSMLISLFCTAQICEAETKRHAEVGANHPGGGGA